MDSATNNTSAAGASLTGTTTANVDTKADVQILAGNQDITSMAANGTGQLGALVQFRNTTLPSVIGDNKQPGSLNQLAKALADRFNALLTSGTN